MAAAAWAVAAWLLWRSAVPSSLRLPHIDEGEVFSASELGRARSFSEVNRLLWVGGVAVELAVLSLFAWRGARFTRESAAGPLGTGMLLGMLGFALLWLATLPFELLGLWWARRHGLVHSGYLESILDGWLELAIGFVLLCVALAIVMGLARRVGRLWWIPAAPAFVALAALFALVQPYTVETHALRSPALKAAVKELEQRQRVGSIPVRVEDVHADTSLPNAEAMGIGPSRRIVLWDTLIDGRFTDREVRVVIGHEIGHIKADHVPKALAWYALFALPGTYLIALVTRRRGGMGQPEAVPLGLLVLAALSLAALPVENLISRHMEAESDWRALEATRDPQAASGVFRRFVATTLSDPSPPFWDYALLETHPTIVQRLAMAEAWRRAQATSAAQFP